MALVGVAFADPDDDRRAFFVVRFDRGISPADPIVDGIDDAEEEDKDRFAQAGARVFFLLSRFASCILNISRAA
jgi:hypothetical protein